MSPVNTVNPADAVSPVDPAGPVSTFVRRPDRRPARRTPCARHAYRAGGLGGSHGGAGPACGVLRRLARTATDRAAHERGDVPGWVLVTLMTAGLVVALWAVAGPTLTQVFVDAIERVTGAV